MALTTELERLFAAGGDRARIEGELSALRQTVAGRAAVERGVRSDSLTPEWTADQVEQCLARGLELFNRGPEASRFPIPDEVLYAPIPGTALSRPDLASLWDVVREDGDAISHLQQRVASLSRQLQRFDRMMVTRVPELVAQLVRDLPPSLNAVLFRILGAALWGRRGRLLGAPRDQQIVEVDIPPLEEQRRGLLQLPGGSSARRTGLPVGRPAPVPAVERDAPARPDDGEPEQRRFLTALIHFLIEAPRPEVPEAFEEIDLERARQTLAAAREGHVEEFLRYVGRELPSIFRQLEPQLAAWRAFLQRATRARTLAALLDGPGAAYLRGALLDALIEAP